MHVEMNGAELNGIGRGTRNAILGYRKSLDTGTQLDDID